MSRSRLGTSLSAGCDENFDITCDLCRAKERFIEAVKHCRQCNKDLCSACCKNHKKSEASMRHHLHNINETIQNVKVKDDLTETCPKHRYKILEYICNNHDRICCSICLNEDHGSCKVISRVPDVSTGIADSREYKGLRADLDRLVAAITSKQKTIDINSQDNEKYLVNALKGIKHFRKKMKRVLKELEQEVTERITKIHTDNSRKLDGVSEKCELLQASLQSMSLDLEAKAKVGKSNQLFVGIKQTKLRLEKIENEIVNREDVKIARYFFQQDEKVQQMKSSLSAMISLSVRRDDTLSKARYLKDINVKSEADSKDCFAVGIAVVDSCHIVVADNRNKMVKLVDVVSDSVTSHLSLSSYPQDLTMIKPKQVAVALGNTIELFTIADVLSRSHVIGVRGVNINKLCYDGANFFAINSESNEVKVINLHGKVIRSLDLGSHDQLCTKPSYEYVAINRERDVLYVTDSDNHTITSLTVGGHAIFVIHYEEEIGPRGIVVGADGTLFVCSSNSGTVDQLTATGEMLQVLLDKKQGLSSWPLAMAFDHEENRLYISNSCADPDLINFIKVFQLE